VAGNEGNKMNAILCGEGHNMRKLIVAFLFFEGASVEITAFNWRKITICF
jgi:hypothetical protein